MPSKAARSHMTSVISAHNAVYAFVNDLCEFVRQWRISPVMCLRYVSGWGVSPATTDQDRSSRLRRRLAVEQLLQGLSHAGLGHVGELSPDWPGVEAHVDCVEHDGAAGLPGELRVERASGVRHGPQHRPTDVADGRAVSRDVLHDGRQLVEGEGVRPAENDVAVPGAFAGDDALD